MLGDNIKELRQRRGLSQQDIADKLNVTRQTVSSWELNRTEPTMGSIEALAKLFNCKKSELIDGSDTPEPLTIDYLINNPDLYALIEIGRKMDKAQLKRMIAYFEYFRDHQI